ncbi:MAG: 30S ribosomal protein S9 [Nitrospinae bacterium]|nr:30S ribosomal protein S9 [Nitrospinota bacterium]
MANASTGKRIYSTGRRKTAGARVWLGAGTGTIKVNGKTLADYFKRPSSEMIVKQPLALTQTGEKMDITATVRGSGLSSQAGAVRHGIARALVKLNPELRKVLKRGGLLTRDSRMKERKKYGQKGARKKFQFSKR